MLKSLSAALLAASLCASPSAWAAAALVKGSPSVAVDIPTGFVASDTEHGVEIKTPDEEVLVWLETYMPAQQDALIAEHDAYWASQGVDLGTADRTTDDSDGHNMVASAFKAATWKGKPTVVRYIFIDAGFPSKELLLMSIWASPEGFKAHNADVSQIVNSIDVK